MATIQTYYPITKLYTASASPEAMEAERARLTAPTVQPPTGVITSDLLAPTTPFTLPQPAPDTTNYNALTANGTGQITSGMTSLFGTGSEADVRAKQAELAGIQAQIQGIVDKRDANLLKMSKDAEGRLITSPILNRQQAEVNRQAAIEALPLQALALAKQAEVASAQGASEYAQSALKMAQDKLNTVFELKQKDIETQYEYRKNLQDKIWNYL